MVHTNSTACAAWGRGGHHVDADVGEVAGGGDEGESLVQAAAAGQHAPAHSPGETSLHASPLL